MEEHALNKWNEKGNVKPIALHLLTYVEITGAQNLQSVGKARRESAEHQISNTGQRKMINAVQFADVKREHVMILRAIPYAPHHVHAVGGWR